MELVTLELLDRAAQNRVARSLPVKELSMKAILTQTPTVSNFSVYVN
jgi:hypothetical protein